MLASCILYRKNVNTSRNTTLCILMAHLDFLSLQIYIAKEHFPYLMFYFIILYVRNYNLQLAKITSAPQRSLSCSIINTNPINTALFNRHRGARIVCSHKSKGCASAFFKFTQTASCRQFFHF